MGGGDMAPPHSEPGIRSWVVTTTPRPSLPRERPGTDCAGGWVAFGAGGESTENLDSSNGIQSPDRPTCRPPLLVILTF